MTDLQGWQKVAREIGDWDWNGDMLIPQCNHSATVGDWLPAEAAAKEILRLRERVKVLEKVREAAKRVSDSSHKGKTSAVLSVFTNRMDHLDAALSAADQQQETDR